MQMKKAALPGTYYILVSKLYKLYDCRYCSYKNMTYEMHTAAHFPFVMAVFLHKCAWTISSSSHLKKNTSFPFSQKHYRYSIGMLTLLFCS